MFKKLRLSLTTILFLAVLAGMAILLWGEEFGLETSEARAQWLSIIAIGAILVCLLGYLDFWTRWAAGFQNLKERLKLHWAGNTTMVPLAMASRNRSNTSDPTSLVSLPGYLRQLYGRNARYRQPWLLLTGDDDVIASFLPALRERSWLVTPDAVLLWSKSSVLGEPDHDWLRQLRTLRRRRPVDMVVLVGNSASLLQRRQHDHAGSALLARTAQGLQWRTPVVVLELHGQDQHHAGTTAVGAEWDSSANAEQIKERLLILRDRLASIAVSQLSVDPGDKYLGELSQRLDERSHALSTWIAGLQQGRGHDGISGVFFAAYPASSEDAYASSPQQLSGAESVLWQRLAKTVRLRTGRRVGWHPETVLSVLALGSLGIWTAGMLVSAATNGRDIAALRQTVMQVTDAPSSDDRLRGLLDLQQQIIRYQYRIAHRAPVESRFGLNRDIPILNALWLPYLAAYRLLRCVRWDTLADVPPHDMSGKTRLVAPRTELRAQLKRLLLQKQWPELLDRVEQAFAEGANHFWLDLQYYAHTAQTAQTAPAHGSGHYGHTGDLAVTDCALMLERLPGIQNLCFSDGSPFAEDITLEWIGRYATVRDIERGDVMTPLVITDRHTDWAETEIQAFEVLSQRGLESTLDWLQHLPGRRSERDNLLLQLVMARLSEKAERLDTALHLLMLADDTARRYQLGSWEPALAFEVKQHLRRLLALRMHRKDADKFSIGQRLDSLLGELTALDPARAVGLA